MNKSQPEMEAPCDARNAGATSALVWPELIPLAEEPEVAAFPLACLPERLGCFCRDLAWAMNAPLDFVGVMVLGLAAGAIGNSRRLRLDKTQGQPALLFAAMIGPPGSVKSPVLKHLTLPFDAAQQRHNDQFRRESESYKAAVKANDKTAEKPPLRTCIIRNATFESIALSLQHNPRGFVWSLDELAGLFSGLNQYKGGNGNDRQSLLSVWAQETVTISRKSDLRDGVSPIFVVNPCLSVVGGIQPDMIAAIRGKGSSIGDAPPDDGGMDRFLFAWPKPLREIGDEGREVEQDVLNVWPNIIIKLLDLECNGDEVRLVGEARKAWFAFTKEHAEEVNDNQFPDHLRDPWSKMKGYGARLALVLHCLRWAAGESVNLIEMDTADMTAAVKLVDYFKSHARKVHAALGSDKRVEQARKVVRWIRSNGEQRFQKRKLFEGTKGTFKTVDALDPILIVLISHGVLRSEIEQVGSGVGRKPSPWYEVNPALWTCSHNSPDSHNSVVATGSANIANSAKRGSNEQNQGTPTKSRKRGSI